MTIYYGLDVNGVNIDDIYMKLMAVIREEYTEETEPSRDGDVCFEAINARIALMNPTRNVLNVKERQLNIRYAVGELMWYFSRNNELSAIRNITSKWDRFSDDGETVRSNYGKLIGEYYGFDQIESLLFTLVANPNTRRAILQVRPPIDYTNTETKDDCCTVYIQFLIRNNKLDCIVNMRSNDIYLGLPNDIFCFTNLQIYLAMRLGIKVGMYYHNVGSLHLYKRDYNKMFASDDVEK